MKFVVQFQDNDDMAHMRQKHMEEHLRFLEHNRDAILAAGPLFDVTKNAPAGGLWLVAAASVEEVMKLVESDPFWPTGLRKSITVLQWNQVFAAGERLLG